MTDKPISKQLRWQRQKAAAGLCNVCGAGEPYRNKKCLKCWEAWLRAHRRFVNRELKALESKK
jgi:hypothetical protein